MDGVKNLLEVSAWKICSADTSSKEGVACRDEFERDEVKADGTLSMAGGMENRGGVTVEPDALPLEELFIGRGGFRGFNSEPGSLGRHHLEEWQVVFIEEDGGASEAFEGQSATDVVDVRVGHDDLLEFEMVLGKPAVDSRNFVAGVDDDGFPCGFVTEQGAVALERADGKGFENHELIVGPVDRLSCALWAGEGLLRGPIPAREWP